MGRAELEWNGGLDRPSALSGAPGGMGHSRPYAERRPAASANLVALATPAGHGDREGQRASEGLDVVFGAGPFSHHLVLRLMWVTGVLDHLAKVVADGGAALQAMNVCEMEGGFSAKIWIKGVSCDAARRLSDSLASLPPVSYAHVEHHLGRAAQS